MTNVTDESSAASSAAPPAAKPAKKPPARPRKRASGEATKRRILDATIEALRTEGIGGASARTIARIGDFNQALIFYHFGSVDDAVMAAVGSINADHRERYQAELAGIDELRQLVEVASELHRRDREVGAIATFVQAAAGAQGNAEMGANLYAMLDKWRLIVAERIEVLATDRLGAAHGLPTEQLSFAITSLFVGIEIQAELDPERAPVDELLASAGRLAAKVDALLDNPVVQQLLLGMADGGTGSDAGA